MSSSKPEESKPADADVQKEDPNSGKPKNDGGNKRPPWFNKDNQPPNRDRSRSDQRRPNNNNFRGPPRDRPPRKDFHHPEAFEANPEDGEQGFGFGRGGPRQRPNFQDRPMRPDKVMYDKLEQVGGPTTDLPQLDTSEKKFSERNRLYLGNLSFDATTPELEELLRKHGEITELFVNKAKNFGFVKYDYTANAQKAKKELDGFMLKGKNLKVRSAPSNAAVKVKNLPPFVSNELLMYAFQVFGEVERAEVLVDEKGKATGEGIVDYSKKPFALAAVRKCTERCFYLTEHLQPCIVEPYQYVVDADGLPEKFFPKKSPDFMHARSVGPRLANPNTFEHDYGTRWKELIDLYTEKELALKRELELEKEKLQAQLEYARFEHETEKLKNELKQREMDKDRQKQQWEMREKMVEEHKRRNEEHLRRRQEGFESRFEDDRRRHFDENPPFGGQDFQMQENLSRLTQMMFDGSSGFGNFPERDGRRVWGNDGGRFGDEAEDHRRGNAVRIWDGPSGDVGRDMMADDDRDARRDRHGDRRRNEPRLLEDDHRGEIRSRPNQFAEDDAPPMIVDRPNVEIEPPIEVAREKRRDEPLFERRGDVSDVVPLEVVPVEPETDVVFAPEDVDDFRNDGPQRPFHRMGGHRGGRQDRRPFDERPDDRMFKRRHDRKFDFEPPKRRRPDFF